MSTPINLDLDFQDYTPSNTVVAKDPNTSNSTNQQSKSVIRIPDVDNRSNRTNQSASATSQKGSSGIINIFQGISTNSGISDEALRQLSWAPEGISPHQQTASSASRGWGLNYFSQYFDITTSDVLQRILWSAVPFRKEGLKTNVLNDEDLIAPLAGPAGQVPISDGDQFNVGKKSYSYLERFIQSRPDLYGPIWVSATLVFAVAIFSNIVSFINFKFQAEKITMSVSHQAGGLSNKSADSINDQISTEIDYWHYSMDELNMMSSVTMVYVTLLPLFISFLFWFRGCSKYYTLTETICAYGYSLSIYIPMSAFLMIQFAPFRYLILTIASLASGFALMLSFLPVARSDPSPASSHIILAIILICHTGLAYIIHRIMLQ